MGDTLSPAICSHPKCRPNGAGSSTASPGFLSPAAESRGCRMSSHPMASFAVGPAILKSST
eukprot:9545462-Alexandrium_andersonii.AAC.1